MVVVLPSSAEKAWLAATPRSRCKLAPSPSVSLTLLAGAVGRTLGGRPGGREEEGGSSVRLCLPLAASKRERARAIACLTVFTPVRVGSSAGSYSGV